MGPRSFNEVPTVTMKSQELRIAAARGLFAQQGVSVSMPDLNSNAVGFQGWTLTTDVLVGALQQAGELAAALVCAKYRVWVELHYQTKRGIEVVDEVELDDAEGRQAVAAIHDDLVAFAKQYVDEVSWNVQQLIVRAQTALQRSPHHLNRTHQLGTAKVTVRATIHRDLGDYLAIYPYKQAAERLERLAASPFRHLEVTFIIERFHRGKWQREASRVVEVHVAHDRWIPASRLLKELRKRLPSTHYPAQRRA